MNKSIFYIIFLALVFIRCAQTQTLTGGPKDIYAATIDSSKTYPHDQQINFAGESMVITFNEFVKIKNPANNFTFTPSLSKDIKYELKGKKLVVDFPEPLKENTTYRLTIDEGIVDYNEGNDSLYTFVFSTGPYIDSACVQGQVKNAFTNKPIFDAYVFLYHPENQDSIKNRRANYFTRTDKNGNFSIQNIKPREYEIITVLDQNQSRSYDLPTEGIGFTDSRFVTIGADSCLMLDLKASSPIDTSIYIKNAVQNADGSFGFSINNFDQYDQLKITNLTDSISFERDLSVKDSILFWPIKNKPGNVLLKIDGPEILDTASFVLKEIQKKTFKLQNNLVNSDLLPEDTLTFHVNGSIESIDSSKFKVIYDDTIADQKFLVLQKDINSVQVIPGVKREKYNVVLDSGAIHLFTKKTNDSTVVRYLVLTPDTYSTIILDVDSSFVNNGYIELYDSNDKVLRKRKVTQSEIRFEKLISQSYFVRFVFDRNNNFRWDPGDYKKRLLPEEVIYLDQSITPKKGWEHKTEWKIKR